MRRPWSLAGGLAVAAILLGSGAGSGAVLFGLLDTGEIYSSGDGGNTWGVLAAVPAHDAVGIAAGMSTSDLYLVTRSGTVYRSPDAGSSWAASGAVAAPDVVAFTITPSQSLLVLTGSGTLYSSDDGGSSFSGLASLTASDLVSLTPGPLGRFFVLARTGEVYESQDQGSTWAAVGGIPASNAASIRRLGIDLYVLTRTGEVFRSGDEGRTWSPVGTITASDMSAILGVGATLIAAAETGEVYASSGGAAWNAVGSIQQLRVLSLGVDTPLVTGLPGDEAAPRFVMLAPSPNPGRLGTGSVFSFRSPRAERVRLDLFDVRGRRVATPLVDLTVPEGTSRVRWAPAGIAPGTYFLRVTSESGLRATTTWSLVR